MMYCSAQYTPPEGLIVIIKAREERANIRVQIGFSCCKYYKYPSNSHTHSHRFLVCPRLGVGEPPESSDRERWNRGDSESSSSSRGQGEAGGLEQGLTAGLGSVGLAPPPSVSMGTVLGLQSTSTGAGWSSSAG